jgi:hypothetical protein
MRLDLFAQSSWAGDSARQIEPILSLNFLVLIGIWPGQPAGAAIELAG